jgi:PHD/YefM family antitoxin component YafN of YafNO toxin-antitoxin module
MILFLFLGVTPTIFEETRFLFKATKFITSLNNTSEPIRETNRKQEEGVHVNSLP